MAKIICTDGTEEYLSPGAATAKVAAGEASWPKTQDNKYSTRQMVAAPVEVKKRKRRTKAEMEAAQAEADEDT
jgi:hypothetical protein